MWALLMAALLAAMGLMIQQYSQPSVRPGADRRLYDGLDAGVLDARPVADTAPLV